MLLRDNSQSSLKGHSDCGEVHEDWKEANATAIFRMAKRRIQGTTNWSTSPQSLERGHPRSEPRIGSQVDRWVPFVSTGVSLY